MKRFFTKMYLKLPLKLRNLLKSKKFIVFFGIMILLIVFISIKNSNKKPEDIISIEKGTIIQEVSLTGTVEPTKNIDYAFDRSGRIDKIYVKTGDLAKEGDLLISLENDDLYSQYQQALASLKIQQIKLDNYIKGSRVEDLQIAQNQYDDAKQKLDISYKNMNSLLSSTYNSVEKIIVDDLNNVFGYMGIWNTETPEYSRSFKTCHNVNINSPLILRKNFENSLSDWKSQLTYLSNLDKDEIYNLSLKVKGYLDEAYNLLVSVNNIIDPNCSLYTGTDLTNIQTHKTSALSAQTSIETLRSSFLQSKSSLDSLVIAYNNAKQNLEIKKNPYTQEDILTQEAIVDQSQASVNSALANYNKTILRAPFSGKITKVVPEIGDIISANQPIISLIGDDNYQIKVNISESDIAKVKINNTAKVTLDAYSYDTVFLAKVIHIDLSATINDGVARYSSIIKFNEKDDRIMPGMTANIDVLTSEKKNVITVPNRAIITKDNKKFVKVLKGKESVLTNIITGIRGSDGNTEVISGLKVGDQIVSK